MGGYNHYEKIEVRPRETYTVISDSIRKEFNDMEPERKTKVIELLQAKVRMLEQKLIADMNRYETEQAEEDRKFFLDYRADGERKISDAQREVAKNASDNIDDRMAYAAECAAKAAKKNVFDRNVMFDQLFGLKADENGELVTVEEKDTVMSAKECSIFDETPFEDIDMTPTKVTLAEDINKELDQLSMPVERMGNVGIVVNKRTHNIVYSNETEDTVTITFERK
jgi:hypothetical protein